MANEKKDNSGSEDIVDLRFPGAKRKNIPPVGLEARGKVVKEKQLAYEYNPHLPPVLRFDANGVVDMLPELLEEAGKRPLTWDEQKLLADSLRNHQPWLEWTGKREQLACVVDPVGLHIHERVATKAILATAARQDIPRSLFADPEQEYREAVQFYQHDVDWSNRLILGDSLSVMASLARREAMAGKVQMIYLDPPYGIKYSSNFQPEVGNREVTDRQQDLTREPEMVKAFRDTWTLGIHSYLSYLRDRLLLAKELLTESGSVFVQISDENLSRVSIVMDEVFGARNRMSLIAVRKTGGLGSSGLKSGQDYILWYAKNSEQIKYRQLFLPKEQTAVDDSFQPISKLDELRVPSRSANTLPPKGATSYITVSLSSSGSTPTCIYPYEFNGSTFNPSGKSSWKPNKEGMARMDGAGRLICSGTTMRWIYYREDFPVSELTGAWNDTGGATDKVYVVQTSTKVIERCLLMTTDPGDIVLDPTCGSGTTAFVAEQWGRRWVTIDCSRVAIAIARQRLLTSKFDFYKLRSINAEDVERNPFGTWLSDPTKTIKGSCTFEYKTVPHVTLKSIARNQALDSIFDKWNPILLQAIFDVNKALNDGDTAELRQKLLAKYEAKKKRKDKADPITDADERRWKLPKTKWEEWEIPFDTDPDYPPALSHAITEYRKVWKAKMDEVNDCIDARADQEELVDQPYVDRKILRVCSPFTVEGVIPGEESINFEMDSPIGGAPEKLDSFGDREETGFDTHTEPQNAEAYIDKIIRLLKADGVLFPNNKHIKFDRLEAYTSTELHAEGSWTNDAGERTVAVVVAPQYGSLSAKMVEDGIRFAAKRGFDELVFAGFSFDGAAQAAIQEDPDPHLRLHMAQIRPDVNMGDLLKTTTSSQIFTVSGTPRTKLIELESGELQVEMEGVDIYDPVTNSVRSTGAEKVAAWFVDANYDGRCFCITQAFFPDKKSWEKLSKALVGTVDPERFETFYGKVSLAFPKGSHNRVAVKVIDPRGNEVMRVHKVGGEYN
jgi:adenine-specific DNA-methyltransferase